MTTELKAVEPMVPETDATITLTQYAGRDRRDGGDIRRLQLTQLLTDEGQIHFIQMSKEQAMMLAYALIQWTQDEREEA